MRTERSSQRTNTDWPSFRGGFNIHAIETDVLIVGTGPTGLTAANLLAEAGIHAITISQYEGTAHTPRAHITNARTMEIFRDLGVEERLKAVGYPLSDFGFNLLITSFAGMEIGRYKSYGTPPDRLSEYAAASPCVGYNIQQIEMEPVLLESARERGADVRFNNRLVAIDQDEDRAHARVVDRTSGQEYEIRAKYVIAADGGRSTVAAELGFEFVGQAGLRGMANCWLEVDLTKYTAHRPSIVHWVAQPGHEAWFGTASWVMIHPWHEWVMAFPWNSAELPSDQQVIERARLTIGDPEADVKVLAVTKWAVNNVVATKYRNGRVFLAGDAAHRHPPTGGLGTNTSVQDAFNLCWKLIAVLRGQAGDGLLDSYDSERQPVGVQVVDRAIKNFEALQMLVTAIGFAPEQSIDDGWAVLHELFSDSPHAAARRAELRDNIELQHYRSNALGVELGQRYSSSAVIDDGTAYPESPGDPILHYRSTTHPGAHIPHAWIERNHAQVSTVDLAGHGVFSLFVGIGGRPWIEAAEKVRDELGIELVVYQVGLRCAYDDVTCEWETAREVDDFGAILVRPDRHVAWRSVGAGADPEKELASALTEVLAL